MGKEPTKAGKRGKYVALHKRAFGTKNKRINGFEKKVRRFQGLAQILFSITINPFMGTIQRRIVGSI